MEKEGRMTADKQSFGKRPGLGAISWGKLWSSIYILESILHQVNKPSGVPIHIPVSKDCMLPRGNGNSQRFLVLSDYGKITLAHHRAQSVLEKWEDLVTSTQHIG